MLRFAPRYGLISPCLERPSRSGLRMRAVNDNAAPALPDATLDAALRLFATHGMGAAARACEQARVADAQGDAAQGEWWLSVCRTLDRRKAHEYVARRRPHSRFRR